jgi:drug/metabolite transporter (DMT)-like permease
MWMWSLGRARFAAGALGLSGRWIQAHVLGWLLITMSLPGLPAWLVGVLLLVQPAGALTLSAVFLGERPSGPQLVGAAVMLAGVLIAASGQGRRARPGGREDTRGAVTTPRLDPEPRNAR